MNNMTDRDQLVREAESLERWFRNEARKYGSDNYKRNAETIRRLLSLLPKEGEVVVPDEHHGPTEEMIHACYIGDPPDKNRKIVSGIPSPKIMFELYCAMIEARPK